MKILYLLALAMFLATPALADITITEPWARASILASRPGAAYLTIKSTIDDRLVELSSPVAASVMIHVIETGADSVGRMVHVEALNLPARREVKLAPGVMHLMLMGLEAKLQKGTSFPLTLIFEKADQVTIEVPVLGLAAAGPEEAGQ